MKRISIALLLLVATACTTVETASKPAPAPTAEKKVEGIRDARQAALLDALGN